MGSIPVPGPFCSTPECAEAMADLAAAADTRDVIGMAKGLLMAGSVVTPDEAFDLLRRASQRENVKVRDIARQLVEARCDPEGRPEPLRRAWVIWARAWPDGDQPDPPGLGHQQDASAAPLEAPPTA